MVEDTRHYLIMITDENIGTIQFLSYATSIAEVHDYMTDYTTKYSLDHSFEMEDLSTLEKTDGIQLDIKLLSKHLFTIQHVIDIYSHHIDIILPEILIDNLDAIPPRTMTIPMNPSQSVVDPVQVQEIQGLKGLLD